MSNNVLIPPLLQPKPGNLNMENYKMAHW